MIPLFQAFLAECEDVLLLWTQPSMSNPLEPDVYDSAKSILLVGMKQI